MKIKLAAVYQCPLCKLQSLGVFQEPIGFIEKNKDGESEDIINGQLICKGCEVKFPIINGIPRFVGQDNYAESFGYQWNLHSKTQLDSVTGFTITRKRLFSVTGWSENMQGQMILEAGSGAGRFTEILLSTDAHIFSFDFSSAVDANWANNGHSQNLNLFQGDIFNIPLPEKSFDKVMCLGVIQHTPDPEKAIKSLAKYVRPGGELVIDVYTKSFISLLQWKYVLRPLTKKINKQTLYRIIATIVPFLLWPTILLRRLMGRIGTRLMPIVEYSNLGIPYEINKQWAILDTFDMYSPAHDHPQSIASIKRWYDEIGFENVTVGCGPNGVIAKGSRPVQ